MSIISVRRILMVWGLLLTATSLVYAYNGLEINSVEVKNHKDNVLRKEVSFTTVDKTSLVIVWWDKALPDKLHRSAVDDKSKSHNFIIKFLKTNRTYGWYAETSSKRSNYQRSENYFFSTGSLPEDLPKLDLKISTLNYEGYTLANFNGSRSYLYMFDQFAHIVWYEYIGRSIRPFNFSRSGNILGLRNGKELFEMDFEGNILWSKKIAKGDTVEALHHEILEDKEGWIFTLGITERTYDLSSVGGKPQTKINADKIIGIDREGKVKFQWDLFQAKNPLEDPDILKRFNDWGHANALTLDSDGNILISFRYFDQVWKINRNSGKVDWKLGKEGNFEMDESAYFFKQHKPVYNNEGHLIIFDNGEAGLREYSRVLVFRINTELMRARIVQSINIPKELSTLKRGSAFPVGTGDYLVCSTGAKSFFLIDKKGNIIWKVQSDKPAYRALPVGIF